MAATCRTTRRRRQCANRNLNTWPLCAAVSDQWRAGDPRAIQAVFDGFGDEFAQRLRKKYQPSLAIDEAEEIVVAALEHAWERREHFDPNKGTLAAWLWRIAQRTAADVVRSRWCRERSEEQALPSENLALFAAPSSVEPADDNFPLVELARKVLSQIEFAVVWADACSAAEVASSEELTRDLGLRPSTICSHRCRALKKLREELPLLGYKCRRPR